MSEPITAVRKLTVEPSEDGLLTMDELGGVAYFRTPAKLLRYVRARDQQAALRGVSTITEIEWRNMPVGFTPPV